MTSKPAKPINREKPHIHKFGRDRWMCQGKGWYVTGMTPFNAYLLWQWKTEKEPQNYEN